jgi:hypothetical protein
VRRKTGIAGSLADEATALAALRDRLAALRDRLAAETDATNSPRILAALSRQFVTVIAAGSEMKNPAGSRVDEIARRRAARRAAVRGE